MDRTDMHRLQEMVRLHRQGLGAREVARHLSMSPNTERTYRIALEPSGLLAGDPNVLPDLAVLRAAVLVQRPVKIPPQQTSSIEAFAAAIHAMAKLGAEPKAIYDKLRLDDAEFRGSLSAVKRLWRRWKAAQPVRPEDIAIPVVTTAGDIAQVDFGYVGRLVDPATGTLRKAWVFVMVLAHSRHLFAKIVFDQRQETWVQLHVEAFAWFGGVVRTVVPDNLKAAVIRAAFGVERGDDGLNRTYRELARYYDFKVDPAPPRAPKKKGRVESGVKYVCRNFFRPRRDETDAEQLQRGLDRWAMEIAGTRDHGTLHARPLDVFEAEEKPTLQPLPQRPYEAVVWKKASVHQNSHLVFDGREYSAPWRMMGSQVWVRATPSTVEVHTDEGRVATHDRRGVGRCTVDAHLPEFRRDLRYRYIGYWRERAALLGEPVREYVEAILASEGVQSKLRVVQGVVIALEAVPPERAHAAAERARFFGTLTHKGLRDILLRGLDREPLPGPAIASPTPRPAFSRAPMSEVA